MYCLFCVVLCVVCVYMCTELLPPGGYPIAVKYIIYHIYHIIQERQNGDFDFVKSEGRQRYQMVPKSVKK